MKKVRAIFAVLTVVTLFGTAALFCSAGGGGGHWEYVAVRMRELSPEEFAERATALGNEGWELFMVAELNGGKDHLIFRRKQ